MSIVQICPECDIAGCHHFRQYKYSYIKTGQGPIKPPTNPYDPTQTVIKHQPQTGWICPVCGQGIAPHVERCPCKKDHTHD